MNKLIKLFGCLLLLLALFTSCEDKSGKVEQLYLAAVDEYTKQEFDNALKYIDMTLKYDSRFYQAVLLKSKIFFMKQDFEESSKVAHKLVKTEPQYTEARIWYIRTLIYTDKLDDARLFLEKELSYNVSDWRVYYLYSLLEAKKGNVDKQLIMLNRAETVLFDSGKVYEGLSDIWNLFEVTDKAADYELKNLIITNKLKNEEIGGSYEEEF